MHRTVILFCKANLEQQVHDVCGVLGVQRRYWFMSQDQFGFLHECPGNGHALLLPSGQGIRSLEGMLSQPHPRKMCQRLRALGAGVAEDSITWSWYPAGRSDQYVLQARQSAHQVEVLEDKANSGAELAHLAAGHPIDRLAQDRGLAGGDGIEPIQAYLRRMSCPSRKVPAGQ